MLQYTKTVYICMKFKVNNSQESGSLKMNLIPIKLFVYQKNYFNP